MDGSYGGALLTALAVAAVVIFIVGVAAGIGIAKFFF